MRLPTASNRTIAIAAVLAALMVATALYIKKTTHPTPAPIPFVLTGEDPSAAPKPSGPKDVATTVLELFSPSDKTLTHQLNETNVRQQIEQLMATSYVLTNCKIITPDDYKNTYLAAIEYAQQNKLAPDHKSATAKVHLIAKTASATYIMIYRRTKCDDAKLPTIAQQLKAWNTAYLPNNGRTARLQPD